MSKGVMQILGVNIVHRKVSKGPGVAATDGGGGGKDFFVAKDFDLPTS